MKTIDQQVHKILSPLDKKLKHLECDGFTRVASHFLTKAGIKHTCWIGKAQLVGQRKLPFHCWITIGEWTVDYRLRMWYGKDAPHGIFKDVARIQYDPWHKIDLAAPPALITALMRPVMTRASLNRWMRLFATTSAVFFGHSIWAFQHYLPVTVPTLCYFILTATFQATAGTWFANHIEEE